MTDESIAPRRICLDRLTPAELAIHAAVEAVEALPADDRLTDAVVLLQAARESVADYVDGRSAMRRAAFEIEWPARTQRAHQSAQPCGCDPGLKYKCREHGGE